MTHEKIIEKTPNGGDYSEIFYLDDDGNPIDSDKATKCIIRECKNDGSLVNEIFGICNKSLDKLMKQYVELFNENFPIALVRSKPDEEIKQILQNCIENEEHYKTEHPEENMTLTPKFIIEGWLADTKPEDGWKLKPNAPEWAKKHMNYSRNAKKIWKP